MLHSFFISLPFYLLPFFPLSNADFKHICTMNYSPFIAIEYSLLIFPCFIGIQGQDFMQQESFHSFFGGGNYATYGWPPQQEPISLVQPNPFNTRNIHNFLSGSVSENPQYHNTHGKIFCILISLIS